MVRVEILAKNSGGLVDARLSGGRKAFAKRADGRIFLDFAPLARFKVDALVEFSIEWNLSLVASLGLPRADVERDLRAAASNDGRRSAVGWGGNAQQEVFAKVGMCKAAAWFHKDTGKLKERRSVIKRMSKDEDIVVLQEVSGNPEDFAVHMPQMASRFRIDVSRGASLAAGGVALEASHK